MPESKVKFIQLSLTYSHHPNAEIVYALDSDGNIWRYALPYGMSVEESTAWELVPSPQKPEVTKEADYEEHA